MANVNEKIRVLLVEDSAINQKLGERLLTQLGCRVTIAENGAEALIMLIDNDYDFIFMDCYMPIINGFETTKIIRNFMPPKNQVPIIALTANTEAIDQQKCSEAGMNGYIAKPVNKKDLLQVLSIYFKDQLRKNHELPEKQH